jgi:selenocysteine lyase/cysteine desulfurase
LHILADNVKERLGAISFYVDDIHYNIIVKLLNDRYGIQTRGGCSCAGTYGHYLLYVDAEHSKRVTDKIDSGDLSEKPGWVRMSIHPTMTNDELFYIINAIKEVVDNINEWQTDYDYDVQKNEFFHKSYNGNLKEQIKGWFNLSSGEKVTN